MVKNSVALGALQAATDLVPIESIEAALEASLSHRMELVPINRDALRRGREAVGVNASG
jgi:Pyruvate/2-oxoacid:ferredoxin oxidoreductase gamma subunit